MAAALPGTRIAPVAAADELSPFTGRNREMGELRRASEVVVGGEGQVIGLVSDPGLGKSRLAFEFRRLAERYVAVIEGRCLSYGTASRTCLCSSWCAMRAGSLSTIRPTR
jgi:hypothetical protein